MKYIIKLTTLFILTVSVSSCTTRAGSVSLTGLTHESVEETIADGKTTKEEIIANFGTRYELSEDSSGKERWVYELTISRPSAVNYVPYLNLFAANANCKNYKLIVVYDENDVVIRHHFSAEEHKKTLWSQ